MQRPDPGTIPDAPGSYQFYDRDGRVLYVGKAASLRSRLGNYFQDPAHLPLRTAQMVAAADRVEWVVVASEEDALLLEHSLIQAHQPRFNIRLKDDKTYPWLALSINEEWPRPFVYRGKQRRGVQYFGPFPHVRALRTSLDLVVKSFPVRTCSDRKLERHQRLGKPCLLFDLERCSGPCIGAVEATTYSGYVTEIQRFFRGETEPMLAELQTEMAAAAARRDYERAARLRDAVTAVSSAADSQEVVVDQSGNLDAFGCALSELEAAIAIFHVRQGRVVGRNGFVVDRVDDLDATGLVVAAIERFYERPGSEVPRQVLVGGEADPATTALLDAWLTGRRGSRAAVVAPSRGRRRQVVEMANRNAAEDLARHELRRASDHNARARALTELQLALRLPEAPLRIECFDMSHLQGRDYVGSMVVFEDGLPKRSDYRHFLVKTVAGNDDFAAMAEVVGRRLRRLDDPEETNRRRFAYRPQLLVVDGGKGQLSAAQAVVDELGLGTQVQLASLAKQFEEVYRPGQSAPIVLPRSSEALFLLQRLRDEAHRFAISFHRRRRGVRMTASALEGVAGLGPTRRTRLLEHFGTLDALRSATVEELDQLAWLPRRVAEAVVEHLAAEDQTRPEGEAGGD